MPKKRMSGIETIIMLKARAKHENIPVQLELRAIPKVGLFFLYLLLKEKREEMKKQIIKLAKVVAEKTKTSTGGELDKVCDEKFNLGPGTCARISKIVFSEQERSS